MSDREIALAKAMLLRGFKNDAIHFYFNLPNRLISPGRITQIKQKKYGANVEEAPQEELDQFLQTWNSSRSGSGHALTSPLDRSRLMRMFHETSAGWALVPGETDFTECKRSFRVSPETRFADVIRSIAGLANNQGGYLFFGVTDKTLLVEGLPDDTFAKTDPAEINRSLAGSLDPVPRTTTATLLLSGKTIGIMHVERHDGAPVIALKNIGTEVREGTVYYRYVGETRAIKPGELRKIISDREQRAVAAFSHQMARIAAGTDATLNLDTGEVSGKSGNLVIDKSLLSNIQFIREGEFSELKGAPALRLIGDVEPLDATERKRANIIRDNVTADAVIRNFLRDEKVSDPTQYVHFQAHSQRKWLPAWYYVKQTKQPVGEIIDDLRKQVATYPANRDALVQRLLRKSTAHKEPTGKPARILSGLLSGNVRAPTDIESDALFATALQGLPTGYRRARDLKPLLLASLDRAQGPDNRSSNRRSLIYRAACRLDELGNA
ncbi:MULTISPECIES: helix-turn-helix domain-containing protein [unclassified Bradyrhizobium]|uniref:AlbA family DNA-binding domain-containing protein n=1 Tax=unclassified Bradyrhizobium TaxID=2631580 RepID=UPI001AED5931|nr:MULTISPECIES: ATP-binding protein [unclassified Bradyrhizobium]